MLSDITLGQYLPGRSVLHRLDARIKLLWALLFIVLVFVADNAAGQALAFISMFAMIRLSGIQVRTVLKGLKPVLFIVLATFILNAVFTPGDGVLWEWGVLHLSRGGLLAALKMSSRLILLVLATQLLTLTTSPIALTDATERLLSPIASIGFPAHELAMMMSIALRFIPTLLEETDKIIKAQTSRGADFESGSLLRRAKAMIPILVPLFLGAFRRADELSQAMEARAYRGGRGHTRMSRPKLGRLEAAAALCGILLLGLVIACNMIPLS